MDWGLGHASRCVKIIRKLNEYGYEVIIGCDNKPLHFLKKEFPNHDFVRLKAMPILYSKYIGASFAIFLQIYKLIYNYIYERYITEKIINQFKIDAIITDVPEPWEFFTNNKIENSVSWVSYLPSMTQVMRMNDLLKEQQFQDIEVKEIILRDWVVDEKVVRPSNKLVSHTGFLISAKYIKY